MVEVMIDYGINGEWIATFADEKAYKECLPALEKYAEANGGKLMDTLEQ